MYHFHQRPKRTTHLLKIYQIYTPTHDIAHSYGVTFCSGIKSLGIGADIDILVGVLAGRTNFAGVLSAKRGVIAVEVPVDKGAPEAEFLAKKGTQTTGL